MDLMDQLKRDEGLRLLPYKDTMGKVTIGYGHNLTDDGITQQVADYILSEDIREAAMDVAKAFPWVKNLDPIRRAVLINMAFNMGIEDLKQFDVTLGLIKKGEYALASDAMLQSKWAREVGDRAKRLSLQMMTGEWQ